MLLDSSLRILFVSEIFWPFMGGAEINAFLVLSKLARFRLKISVLTHRFPGHKSYEFCDKLGINRMNLFFSLRSLNIFQRWLFYLKSTLVISRFVVKEQPNLILTQQLVSLPALLVSKLFRIPVVVVVHDYWPICYYRTLLNSQSKICSSYDTCFHETQLCAKDAVGQLSRMEMLNSFIVALHSILMSIHTSIAKYLLQKADAIIAVSHFVRKILISNQFDSRKIYVVYNPVEVKGHVSALDNDIPQILYVGRLDHEKGVEFLFEAVSQICSKMGKLKLIVVGIGPRKEYLQQLANHSQIAHCVNFLGKVDEDVLMRLYWSSNVVVVPSLWPEPSGRVIVEALMCRCPVIASNVGGIPELISNNVGVLVPPKDTAAISDALVSILKGSFEFKLDQITHDKFSPDKVAVQMLNVIKRVIKRSPN